MMLRAVCDDVYRAVEEAVADLTIAEADAVLEAVRLTYRIIPGPTTNRDARELLARIEEASVCESGGTT